MTSAEICRRNGWVAGDVIESVSEHPERQARVRITAIGEDKILARQVARMRRGRTDEWVERAWNEQQWDLGHREWRKAEQ